MNSKNKTTRLLPTQSRKGSGKRTNFQLMDGHVPMKPSVSLSLFFPFSPSRASESRGSARCGPSFETIVLSLPATLIAIIISFLIYAIHTMLRYNAASILSVLLFLPLSEANLFEHWYPFYSVNMRDIAGPHCYPNYTHGDFPEYRYPQSLCAKMSTCLLQNTDEFSKADMQSATIILGLMPTILSYFGSKAGEMSLLSARRPILTALLAFGAPAVFTTRPFELDDPAASLKRDIGTLRLGQQTPGRAAAIGVAQYLFATLAAANCVLNSVQLGTSTILSWKCSWSYMELIWNLMALVSHLCAVASIRYSKVSHRPFFSLASKMPLADDAST